MIEDKKLKEELDNLWSKLVKLKARNKCEYCGREDTLNSHHIYSRSNPAVRWDERNGCCLCALHHVLGQHSFHKSPIEMLDWLRDKRGENWYIVLRLIAFQTHNKIDKKLTLIYLKNEIKRYEKIQCN